jgi:hypothetical protein
MVRMGVGQHALRLVGDKHRGLQRLSQPAQRGRGGGLRRFQPHDQHGPLRPGQQRTRITNIGRGGRCRGRRRRHTRRAPRGFPGQVEMHRAALVLRSVEKCGDLDRRRLPFRARISRDEGGAGIALIENLVGDVGELLRGESVRDQHDRRAFQAGAGQPVQRIAHARALGRQHHARRARQLGIRKGGHRRRAFMLRQHEADPEARHIRQKIERGAAARHAPDALRAAPGEIRQQRLCHRAHGLAIIRHGAFPQHCLGQRYATRCSKRHPGLPSAPRAPCIAAPCRRNGG